MSASALTACSHSPADQLDIFRRAATMLASTLDLDQTLANTIRAMLPALGDFGFFDAVVGDEVRRTAAAHQDPVLEAMLAATRWRRQEPTAARGNLNLCALSSGEAARHVDIDDDWYRRVAVDEGHLAGMRHLAFSAMISVPVCSGDELIGSLTLFMSRSGRSYTEGDLAFAAELAALAAPVVAHAKLLDRQRRAEAALRDSEACLRMAVNAGRIGIWDWNLETGAVAWSDQVYALHGLAPGGFGGRFEDFAPLVHRSDAPGLFARIEACRASRGTFDAEFRIVRPDGNEAWLATWAQCGVDAAGTERMVGATIDITEQKRLNVALTDLNNMLEQRVQARTSERDRIWRMSHDVLAVLAPGGRLSSINPAFTNLLGWPHDAAGGDGLLSLVHPDGRARLLAALAGGIAADGIEVQMRHRDGGWRWLSWTLVPEGGQVYGVGRDVTEAKRQHDELLLASEMRLQLALDAGGMGAWQWDVQSGRTWWWPGMERLHGEPAGTPAPLLDAYQERVLPEDRERLASAVGNALRDKRDYRVEYRIRLLQGEVRWIEAHAKLQLDENGEVASLAGVCVDITRRKRIEDDLRFAARASAELASLDDIGTTLRRVTQLAVPGFADWCALDMLAPDGGIERVAVAHVDPSKTRLAHELFERYGPKPGDGDVTWRIIAAGSPVSVAALTDEMLEAGIEDPEYRRVLLELGLRSYIGVPVAVRGRTLGVLSFVAAESGRHYGPDDVALAEDIGRRAAVAIDNANLYRALQTADQRKDEFLAMLAHELRNPLAPIRAAADLLSIQAGRAGGAGPSGIAGISAVLTRQVGHMTALVDDLLDVSRVTRGSIELDRVPVDIRAVAAAAVEQVRPLAEARKHRLQVRLDAGPMTVMGDEKRLVQILANLLNNAAKYTPPGGQIELLAGVAGGRLQLEVRDNGIGMSADLVARAFELFSQAARSSDRSQGGLGLGLALVRRLVELHGGEVHAYSSGEGCGSRFAVRLPLLAATRDAPASTAPTVPQLRVLVVDDNVDAATLLGAFLETAGHRVDVLHDACAALARTREDAYDVCLLDIGLPGMDGLALAGRIRERSGAARPVLVAVSGYGQPHDRQAALAAGFDHYLVKPIGAIDLHALIAQTAAAGTATDTTHAATEPHP